MPKTCDAQLRYSAANGGDIPEADKVRVGRLEAARRARIGDWSEEELERMLCGLPVDRPQASKELKRACLGAGDLDRRLTLAEAAEILGIDGLHEAAKSGELATFPGGKETSEARLGAWLISQERLSEVNPPAALRMAFLCGLKAGERRKA